jgi:hypothetical protein
MDESVQTYRLSDDEREGVRALLAEIAADPRNLDEAVFLAQAVVFAQELPRGMREALYRFKLQEPIPALLFTNNPVTTADVGPTPSGHSNRGASSVLNIPQLMHGLYASSLGELFGFESQQYGRIFNDLISLEGQPDNSSSGCGAIGLHTEDCVKSFMPDYLGLLCLRNETAALTLVSSIVGRDLPADIRDTLMTPVFPELGGRSNKRCLLFGSSATPYLRYGSIDVARCDPEASRALQFLRECLETNRRAIALSQGDCLYLDNYHAVHGRAPFEPRYGANARWFSRVVVTRDLRRTRAIRASPGARVMIERDLLGVIEPLRGALGPGTSPEAADRRHRRDARPNIPC